MSHLQPQIEFGYWIIADGDQGTEVIPGDLVSLPDGYTLETAAELLRDYLESRRLFSVEECSGYCARLSAPGYLDCTDWCGPYETEEEARESLAELYGDE